MLQGLRFLAVFALTGTICSPACLPPAPASAQSGAPPVANKQTGASNSPASPAAAEANKLNLAAVRALSTGQYAQAIELLDRARRLLPGDPGIAVNLGLAYVRAGRFPEAVAPLKLAVAGSDKKDTARFLLGSAYFEIRQFQLAAEQLEFVRSSPGFAENALYFLEESYRKSGNAARAEQAFVELTKLKPDSALVHKLLGTAYDTQGRFPEALAEFQTASLSDPGLPEVRFDAGLLCLKLHDEAAARKWFEAELKLNPCYAAAHYYLGDIDRKASRWASAAESFREAIRCAPAYPEAHLALGIALQAQGLDNEALPVLRRAVELAPATSEAHFHLARAFAKAGRTDESRAEWKKAQDLTAAQEQKK